MNHRSEWPGLFLFLFFWLALAGCGTEQVTPDTDPTILPEEPPSCETLEPRIFQNPLTGSEFHCLWCNREWKWTIPADSQGLFVLVAFTCERLRSEAYLEIRDAQESIVWQREIRPGDDETHCIRHGNTASEVLSIRLHGSRDLLLLPDLIKEFRGSVYVKVFNERGHLVVGPDS